MPPPSLNHTPTKSWPPLAFFFFFFFFFYLWCSSPHTHAIARPPAAFSLSTYTHPSSTNAPGYMACGVGTGFCPSSNPSAPPCWAAQFNLSLRSFSFLPLASQAIGKREVVALSVGRSSRRQSAQPNIRHSVRDEYGHGYQFSSLRISAHVTELAGSDESGRASRQSVSEPRARLLAKRTESLVVDETCRPLAEYMSLPASQYSVLDAERIERIDNNTFRCHVYRFKIFKFEVCPVLLVRVEERPNGCCIRLLSCTLEGSPMAVAQNKKFSASMANEVSWSYSNEFSSARQLTSHVTIEVVAEIPTFFRVIPVELIESTGTHALDQLLRLMVPRFLAQLGKDYRAWASGDSSRRPLGSGQL